jgi:hypothetical protein
MINKIFEIINQNPKHFSKIVKNKQTLYQWVKENTLISSEKFAEEIYSAIYKTSNICPRGKIKKFKNIKEGFKGCGLPSVCECAKTQVSESVKKSKINITPDQQENINAKRSLTNLKKYGVSNVAQTQENRQKFRDWYADPANVEKNLKKIRETNLKKYGVANCKSLPEIEEKIIATCLARYGVTNVSQIPSTKAKLKARTAEYVLSGKLLKSGYDKFSKYIEKNYNFKLITLKEEYQGCDSDQIFSFNCLNCNQSIQTKFYYGRGIRCETCNPRQVKFVSNEEQEVFDYINKDLDIQGIQQDKKIINPYELDMVFEDYKIAIEYCGLYWHSEFSSGKNKYYHQKKLNLANQKGYRLITIFSDEWNFKKEIVKSKLKNIFKKTQNRYYARKLKIHEVPESESKLFQEKHHLQGYALAKISLGLYNKNELVALMTFSNGRVALNTKTGKKDYELVRFLTNGASVVGGASKLLKYFIDNYKPDSIVSYADNRWSNGNLYSTLGFVKESTPTLGYWYVEDYLIRKHRYNFRKSALVEAGNNPEKTEWQIMKDLGYDRIWDCGHTKFSMNCKISQIK